MPIGVTSQTFGSWQMFRGARQSSRWLSKLARSASVTPEKGGWLFTHHTLRIIEDVICPAFPAVLASCGKTSRLGWPLPPFWNWCQCFVQEAWQVPEVCPQAPICCEVKSELHSLMMRGGYRYDATKEPGPLVACEAPRIHTFCFWPSSPSFRCNWFLQLPGCAQKPRVVGFILSLSRVGILPAECKDSLGAPFCHERH